MKIIRLKAWRKGGENRAEEEMNKTLHEMEHLSRSLYQLFLFALTLVLPPLFKYLLSLLPLSLNLSVSFLLQVSDMLNMSSQVPVDE